MRSTSRLVWVIDERKRFSARKYGSRESPAAFTYIKWPGKNLRYDGKSSWLSFKQRFESYRSVMNYGEQECRDYLNWSLEGKALDFILLLPRKRVNLLIQKYYEETSKPFWVTWIGRNIQSQLTPSCTDARRITRRLDWQIKEAASKFCRECVDQDAGKHACLEHLRSIQAALNAIKHYQYISQPVEGKKLLVELWREKSQLIKWRH